jgi:hypothetical protein
MTNDTDDAVEQFLELVIKQPHVPKVLGGNRVLSRCPRYVDRPPRWTCLDEQARAASSSGMYGKRLKRALEQGLGLCLRCRAKVLLAALRSDVR